MAYLFTPKLDFPLTNYKVNSYKFGEECTYDGVYWGIHLGEDINVTAGTKVKSIGQGKVVYSRLHKGSKEKPNWGNIVIIAHKNPKTKKVFYSLYAHLKSRKVKKSNKVDCGKIIGVIGAKNTPENGWWKDAHLHFGIYTGPNEKKVPPGYYTKSANRTKLSDWQNPSDFVKNYASVVDKNKN